MSITFYCPDAPKSLVPCWCKEDGDECWEGCPGTRNLSEAPEVNYANVNACNLIRLVGFEADYCGTWTCEELPAVLRGIMRALNSERTRAPLVREAVSYGGERAHLSVVGGEEPTGGCRVIIGGNTDARTVERLEGLQNLVRYAQEHGYSVQWS